MKKLTRNVLLGLLGLTFGLYTMSAPTMAYAQPHGAAAVGKVANAPDGQKRPANNAVQDPVEVVKAAAGKLGFDARKDSFALVSKSATQAVVSVRHNGAVYNVTLKSSKSNAQWTIAAVNKVNKPAGTSGSATSGNSSANTSSGTTSTASSSDVTAAEQKAVELMNADRRANGLSNLQVSSALTAVARSHAQDIVARNFFSHTNPDGKTLADRLKQAGISFSAAGENIAENISVQAAETTFMNSSGHRSNILNSTYTTVGIGVAFDSKGNVYVVQDFIK